MRILVTGGAGFIGSHIVDGYISQGHKILVVDNLRTGLESNLNPDAEFEKVDIRSEEFERVLSLFKPDIVSHHAAQMNVRHSADIRQEDASINIMGSINVFDASLNNGVKGLIFSSSGGTVYGNNMNLPLLETEPLEPIAPYGIAKSTVERYLKTTYAGMGFNVAVLRYANVYGPRQNPKGEAGVISIFLEKMLEGQTPAIYGKGDHIRDYVHVSDVVNANIKATRRLMRQSEPFKVYNVGSGIGSTVMCIYELLAKYTNYTGTPEFKEENRSELRANILDITKIKAELGWSPKTKLEKGIKQLVDYTLRG